MELLRKLCRLPPTDRRLLIRVSLLLAATRVALACLPFRFVRRLLCPSLLPVPHIPGAPAWPVDRVGWAVQAAGRRVLKANNPCLAQALVAHRLLLRSGYPADLRIGVTRADSGDLEAHAWVECRGRIVVGGGALSRYTPLGALAEESP